MNLSFEENLANSCNIVNKKLEDLSNKLLKKCNSKHIVDAMIYSILPTGKCIRSYLLFIMSDIFKVQKEAQVEMAILIEIIHSYSLVHDDLPALDNDDYRRNKLSCHKKFGESTAILTGDALIFLVFQLLSESTVISNDNKPLLTYYISEYCGYNNMIAGQVMDLDNTTENNYNKIAELKTSCLFKLICKASYILANNNESDILNHLEELGRIIGTLFQIKDDYLDKEDHNESYNIYKIKDQENINENIKNLQHDAYNIIKKYLNNNQTLIDYVNKISNFTSLLDYDNG